jgi:signal transduction histidine kinase
MKTQAYNKNITLKNSIDTDFTIAADANLLSAVLRNLISNSIKFTPEGGTITISLSSHYGDPMISVQDTGVGMSPEQANKLFSLNEHTTSLGTAKEHGTGLGLILCKEFVEKHGGSIMVKSTPNNGSTFSFTLPQNIQTYADIEVHPLEQ